MFLNVHITEVINKIIPVRPHISLQIYLTENFNLGERTKFVLKINPTATRSQVFI